LAEQAYAYVTLIPVAKGFQSSIAKELGGVDDIGKTAGKKAGGKFSSSFGGALKGLAAAAGGALAAAGVGNFVSDSIKQASNLSESLNAVNVSFGAAAGGINQLGKEAAASLGLSNQQFNQLAVGFTAFAERIAGPGGDVVGVIDDLTTRGADFASVMNLEVEEALTLFRSGLAGETEPLRKFGIDVSEASVKAFAYASGIAAVGTELTEQQKVQARYASIMEQTNKMAGDFANTSDGLANSQRILKATFADVQAEVGGALLPVMAELTTSLIPLVQDLTPVFKDLLMALAPVVKNLVDNMGPLINALKPLFEAFNLIIAAVSEIVAELMPPMVEIFAAITPVILDLVKAFMPLIQAILPPLVEIIKSLVPVIEIFADYLRTWVIPLITFLGQQIGTFLGGAIQIMADGIKGATDILKPFWDALKPILEGLLALAGIKPQDLNKKIKIDYSTNIGDKGELARFGRLAPTPRTLGLDGVSSTLGATTLGGGSGAKDQRKALRKLIKDTRADFKKAREEYAKEVADLNKDFEKAQTEIGEAYNEAVAKANETFAKRSADIAKQFDKAVSAANKRRDEGLANALAENTKRLAEIQKDFAQRQADIIQQSMNRLRDAYRSAVAINVASIFDSDELAGSIDGTVEVLREKLLASQQLIDNAAKLNALGFSQTFIEQVVGAGTELGNELANSILGATPDTIAELKSLYGQLETQSETAMDSLAQAIYDEAGLATSELKALYATAQAELAIALEEQNQAYQTTIAEINAEFNQSIVDAQIARDEALLDAQAALDEAIAEAKTKRDKALQEAMEALQEALIKAAENFDKDITKIQSSFNDKIATMKGAVKGLAGEISALQGQIASAQAAAAAIKVPQIPVVIGPTPKVKLAEGGLVTGPTNALIGEAGPEVVIPLDRFESMMNMTGSNASVNYYAAPNQSIDSERDLFQAMRRAKVVVGW